MNRSGEEYLLDCEDLNSCCGDYKIYIPIRIAYPTRDRRWTKTIYYVNRLEFGHCVALCSKAWPITL